MNHLTVTEVAEALQVSTATVKRYIYDGRIASVKLPGGQHRIPRSEVDRILSAVPVEEPSPAQSDQDLVARVEVLERWVTEQEAEIERLSASLQVLATYAEKERLGPSGPPSSSEQLPPRVLVLGPGCRRCQSLYELTAKALRSLGIDASTLGKITDVAAIAQYGPVLTPALVIDGELVLSGRVPSEATLRDTLARRLTA